MTCRSTLTMDSVVSHCQGDRPLGLGLEVSLCVGGVCVVVFGLHNILTAQTWVHWYRPDPGGKGKTQYVVKYNPYKCNSKTRSTPMNHCSTVCRNEHHNLLNIYAWLTLSWPNREIALILDVYSRVFSFYTRNSCCHNSDWSSIHIESNSTSFQNKSSREFWL